MAVLPLVPLTAAALGAIVGSFVTTAALRAAAERSPLGGRSACDACERPLGYLATVPIASYVALGGRCAGCKAHIPPAHLFGEVAGAAAGLSIVLTAPSAAWAPLGIVAAVLLFAAVFDSSRMRIPDPASAAVAVLGLLAALVQGRAIDALVTGVAVAAVLLGAREVFRRIRGRPGLGLGDVKLAAALALWTGATHTSLAMVSACVLGLIWLRRAAPTSDGARIPFGPFLAAGFWPFLLGRFVT